MRKSPRLRRRRTRRFGRKRPQPVRWQAEAVSALTGEKEWQDLASGERFSLTANAENLAKKYRVALFDGEGILAASAALSMPALTAAEEETPEETVSAEEIPDEEVVEAETADATVANVFYVKRGWNGQAVTESLELRENVTAVPTDGAMTSGWYYLNSSITVGSRIELTGDT